MQYSQFKFFAIPLCILSGLTFQAEATEFDSVSPEAKARASQYFERAAAANLANEYQKALAIEQEALEFEDSLPSHTPDFNWIRATKGVTLRNLGREAEAVRLTVQMFKESPEDRACSTAITQAFPPKVALAILQKAVIQYPSSEHIQMNIGKMFLETGQHETAEQHFRLAIKLNPKRALNYALLGNAIDYPIVGKHVDPRLFQSIQAAAREAYNKALEIDPKSDRALAGLKAQNDVSYKTVLIRSWDFSRVGRSTMSDDEYWKLLKMDGHSR